MCPFCHSERELSKNGSYVRPSDGCRLRRFRCRDCRKTFSETHFSIHYRLRKRRLNQAVFRFLSSGVSQRRCAFLVGVMPRAIARRVDRFGRCSAHNLDVYRKNRTKTKTILIDEMESFEHTKCKPLTIPIAVEDKTRKILSLAVGKIAAKGHLAQISRRKYGPRLCERKKVLERVFSELKDCADKEVLFKSDESQHYPAPIQEHFPKSRHQRYKGRAPARIGQGELKKGGRDPLFYLNHTYAMFRDNLKTLARRTWCTCKRVDRLESLMFIYANFHNLWLERKKRKPELSWLTIIN